MDTPSPRLPILRALVAACAALGACGPSNSALAQTAGPLPFESVFDPADPVPEPLFGAPPRQGEVSGWGQADASASRILPAFFQIQEGPELDLGLPLRPEPPLPPFPPPVRDPDADPLPESPPAPPEPRWYEKMRITGYSQFRVSGVTWQGSDSAPPHHAGDQSIAPNETFLIRRGRLIFAADVSEHIFFYFQPDFATTPPGSPDANHFLQIRDLYADVFLDKQREFRFRVGQSKVPYGWENVQSSSRRAPLDRNDAFNSATRNERDLGVFFYWTPQHVQDVFKTIAERNLKTSGNYGVFGIGPYVGQGGSFREQNDDVHLVSRLTWPFLLENGQILELSMQGYTGQYVVLGSPISPTGTGPAVIPQGTRETGERQGHLDQRLGWTAVYYPQPFGVQAEWTIGRGPALNPDQTALERRSVSGGYVMLLYKLDDFYGTWFPYTRWQFFRGGYKSARNSPFSEINELELGVDWNIRKEMRLTLAYLFTDRTNLAPMGAGAPSYDQFVGQVIRTQLQVNY